MIKKQRIKEEKILQQPTIYTFNFLDVPVENYGKVLDVLFHNPDFRTLAEQRNRIVKSADRMRYGSSEILNTIRTIQAKDRKLADLIFAALVQANLHSKENYEFLSFSTLQKYYIDYNREGIRERVTRLSANLNKVTFMADMLESLLVDVKADMKHIFNGEVEYNQFDSVTEVLKQLTAFFGTCRSKEADSPDAKLYLDYADSINAYLEKRMKTYTDKYRKIHPPTVAYSEQNMIEALNQFFGKERFFGHNFIKHTECGGPYIDAFAVAFNLNKEQSEKLDKAVGKVPSNNAQDATMKYAFAVTDAIMKDYIPNK